MPIKLLPGDRVELKKQHPCGGTVFTVLRAGMDVRLQCETCGAQIHLNRPDLEKRIRKLLSQEEQ